MSEPKYFKLPDVGEGLTEAEIVKWHVAVGDEVEINQTIIEIETAKAIVELPCPFEGVVAELLVAEGETVDVGVPIIGVRTTDDAEPAPVLSGQKPAGASGTGAPVPTGRAQALREDLVPSPAADPSTHIGPQVRPDDGGGRAAGEGGEPKRQPVLVGYGVKPGATKRRPRKAPTAPPDGGHAGPSTESAASTAVPGSGYPQPVDGAVAPPEPSASSESAAAPAPSGGGATVVSAGPALAKPPVRKLAKDLGVDLRALTGTGPQGSITREDVRAAVATASESQSAGDRISAAASTPAPASLPSASVPTSAGRPAVPAGQREERIPVKSVRRSTAAAVAASAFTAPHVTEFLQVDVTATMDAVRRLRELPEYAGVKVSPLLLVAKAVLLAVRRNPQINSTWVDGSAGAEIVVKHYVNLGIAAATPRGLIVPNVKDAHELTLPGLAAALTGLAETARAGKASPADLSGGTITITNVGVFGVDGGTPIITPGEAAILAFGQVRDMPWVHQGELAIRKVTTLSLSFDHRIVDGELGSAVLRDIGAMLEDPLRMLAWS